MHNRAPLPPDPSYRLRSEKEPVVSRLDVEEFRRIVLASNPLYRAVWLCMLQGGMGSNELIYWSNHGWRSLQRQLREGRYPIRIDLPGRKHNRNIKSYYTFLGRDALEALETWLEHRPPGARSIFEVRQASKLLVAVEILDEKAGRAWFDKAKEGSWS